MLSFLRKAVQPIQTLAHDASLGSPVSTLILNPRQHGAVLLLLVTIQVQFGNCGGESFDEFAEICEGGHTPSFNRIQCEIVGTEITKMLPLIPLLRCPLESTKPISH